MRLEFSKEERDAIMRLVVGRLARLASRPSQPGDIAQFEACRRVAMEVLGDDYAPDYLPNLARQRGRGAQGQW